jgi:hypothetical protein
MYEGKGANYIFPEDWEAYESVIPVNERDNFIKAYHRRLTGEFGEKEMIRAAKGVLNETHYRFLRFIPSFSFLRG